MQLRTTKAKHFHNQNIKTMKTPKENMEIPNFQKSDLVILKSDPQELKYCMVITEINEYYENCVVIYTDDKGKKIKETIQLCALVHFTPKEE